MKAFLKLLTIGILALAPAQVSHAQGILGTVDPITNNVPTAAPFSGSLNTDNWLPGRMWFEVNLADNGLGYRGSFATIGGKSRLFQDAMDGRWLGEANLNLGLDTGGFFYNLGIERAFSIDAAGADFVMGAWFDSDNDEQGGFGHTLNQMGASAALKTKMFDITGNGYIPVGTTDHRLEGINGSMFLNHNIVLQPGIDSALQGFDVTLSVRPTRLAMYGGSFQLGGYQYSSGSVPNFNGIRLGTSFQAFRAMTVGGEVTYDDRFDTTGVVQLGWAFGGAGGNQDFGTTGTDLEKARRQAHVARFTQDLILAVNPVTGLPYNVQHVDNSVVPGGDGTFESRFDTLAGAEAIAAADDIVFIHNGDDTTRNLNTGIALKDRQQLLGDGLQHVIQTQFGSFALFNDLDGQRATITNDGGAAVTLADGNTVRGLIIDGSGVTMTAGITGTGVSATSTGPLGDITLGLIDDNIVRRAQLNGIDLNSIEGDWTLVNNTVNRSGQDGISISGASDATSQFVFQDNTITSNVRDGIHMENYDGRNFIFEDNITNTNGRHGIGLENFTGARANYAFLRPTARSNISAGISVDNAVGRIDFLDVRITNNLASGIRLKDITHVLASDQIVIGLQDDLVNVIRGNGVGAGAGISTEQNSGTMDLFVQDTRLVANGVGFQSDSRGFGTLINTTITNSGQISDNLGDGIRILASNGATNNFTLTQTTGVPLRMLNNGAAGGNGITMLAQGNGLTTSTINAEISNVLMQDTTNGNGIFGQTVGDAALNLNLRDSSVSNSGFDGIGLDLASTSASAVSRINIDNTDIVGAGDDGIGVDLRQNQLASVILSGESSVIMAGGDNGVEFITRANSKGKLESYGTSVVGAGGGATPTSDGFDIDSLNTSDVAVIMEGNTVVGNGGEGVSFVTRGLSQGSLQVQNGNAINANGNNGVYMVSRDNSIMNTLLDTNNMSGNGLIALGARDITAIKTIGPSTICLAMTNNNYTNPRVLNNTGAPVDFTLETAGFNGPGANITLSGPGSISNAAFGTVCQPAIDTHLLSFGF